MRMKTGRLVILSQFQLEKNQARIQLNQLDRLDLKSPARFDLSLTTEQPDTFSDMFKELEWGTLETRRKTNNKLVPNSETKKT